MFRKILLAYDGSPGAKRALDVALELTQASGAELWALAVEERLPHYAATIDEVEEAREFANRFYQEALSVAYLRALKLGIQLRSEIRAGHAARTIVDFTREGGFDLVVLGSSGHSRAWMMFLGTTAEKVSRHVPCTVLLVR
ncbi:MAG TPA: universal stress protein [Ktedonobacteraceae bacterium]|nr:universal stress protein [Ktedonobacteraceae bacterium]HZU68750.1 universal stress protein [Ktedonobacteraceae bacterium]